MWTGQDEPGGQRFEHAQLPLRSLGDLAALTRSAKRLFMSGKMSGTTLSRGRRWKKATRLEKRLALVERISLKSLFDKVTFYPLLVVGITSSHCARDCAQLGRYSPDLHLLQPK